MPPANLPLSKPAEERVLARVAAPSGSVRICALVPTYDNPRTIEAVVRAIREHCPDVVVIDDGSGPEGRAAVDAIGRAGLAHVHHRPANGGKGAAVKTGFRVARKLGFTHALQVDADGQHDLHDIPRFLEAARANPRRLILGAPVYDDTAPRSRLVGRQITRFWTHLETGGRVIEDPMCGFRVYPLEDAIEAAAVGNRMEFDIEIAVRMVWRGLGVLNLPTAVRYLPAEAGGVSHFRMWEDNVRISWMHTRLVNRRVFAFLLPWLRLG